MGPLSDSELSHIDNFVSLVSSANAQVILDPHNAARYNNAIIGAPNSGVTQADFADFWGKVATHYMSNQNVIFGLMNEPNTMATELWRDDANAGEYSS